MDTMTEAPHIYKCRDLDVQIPDSRTGRPVKAAEIPTSRVRVADFLSKIRGKAKIESLSHQENVAFDRSGYGDNKTSRFFHAVHECFAKHLPLALSPEVLMYLVLHEISVTVKLHPKHYRNLFTTSAGKELITVRHDGLRLGDPDSPWHETMPMFEEELGKMLPSDVLKHALPKFNTHTDITRAASMVAFMDMASPYYDYRVMTKCGIPKIRLHGTAADWTRLYVACKNLAPLFSEHLTMYFRYLLPVIQKIEQQANDSEYDNDFWSSIYKHLSGSGSDCMTGWLTAFLNYTVDDDNTFVPKNLDHYDWEAGIAQKSFFARGYDRSAIPSHVNSVPFIWEYFETEIPMAFLGGIFSIADVDGYVTPGLGFAVLNKGE